MKQENIIERDAQMASIDEESRPFFNLEAIFKTVIFNWPWFVISVLIALACGYVYNRYLTPTYQAGSKMLVKVQDPLGLNRGRFSGLAGTMNTISEMGNEMEIIKSKGLAQDIITDLKLYVEYESEGFFQNSLLYKKNPITVDIDAYHLSVLPAPIKMQITRENNVYEVTGTYYVATQSGQSGPYAMRASFATLPNRIVTRAGYITFNSSLFGTLRNGNVLNVTIYPPRMLAGSYASSLTISGKDNTSMLYLIKKDKSAQRAIDYLKQLVICYNRQSNEDKNLVALRTEEFINTRIEKFGQELGSTESAIESFKQRHHVVELKSDATEAAANARSTEKQLADMEVQLMYLNSMTDIINDPANKYQLLPTNYGLSDPTSSGIISQYNAKVLERNRLMRTAGESNPSLIPITTELDNLLAGLKSALAQARRHFEMQRGVVQNQLGNYYNKIDQTPQQERILSEIGRQHELKNAIYQTLLQKREENSISLAATADKARLLEEPSYAGTLKTPLIMISLIAILIGLLIPSLFFFIREVLRYKIEAHEDVEKITKLPIIADVPIASDTAKTKADIVVHENQNNQMEEIFRSMRTNLNFMLGEGQKVILFTSTTSGEGKTFNAANLAVSYALLDKKVIIVGLDIRKPRLAELFEISDHHHGITPLLPLEDPTFEQIQKQILPSGVHDNLDLLMAGPIPPNPAELLARESLVRIIDKLREHYDYIILDTAPVGLVTDTLQVGRVADATVYMCRADYTPKQSLGMVNALAEQEKLPNISIVINGIDMSKKKYGYYYGYGKYGKYSKYGSYYSSYYGHNGKYGKYGQYGRYGGYGNYHAYGYGDYRKSNYANQDDDSIKV